MRLSLSLGAWWPEGRSSSSVSQFLPSCSWSAVVVLFCHHPPKYSSIFPRNTSSIQYYLIVSNYQDPTDSLMLFSYSLGSRRKQWGNFFYILSLSEPGFESLDYGIHLGSRPRYQRLVSYWILVSIQLYYCILLFAFSVIPRTTWQWKLTSLFRSGRDREKGLLYQLT